MIQRAKKEVFGHFLDFGLLDRLNIAYFDSAKQSLRFDHVISQSVYNQLCIISIIYAKTDLTDLT